MRIPIFSFPPGSPRQPRRKRLAGQRHLSLLLFLSTLAPLLMLLFALREHHVAARMAQDVNRSGSLRYRSLWLYGATHQPGQVGPANWRPALSDMAAIRADLRTRYLGPVAQTDDAWNALSGELTRAGQVDWITANRMRDAADALTREIAREVAVQDERVIGMVALGTIGLGLLSLLSARLQRGLQAAESAAEAKSGLLEQTNAVLAGRQNELDDALSRLAESNHLLAHSSRRFQEMFQGLPIACFCCDADANIVEWNRACENFYGREAPDVFQRPVWEIVSPSQPNDDEVATRALLADVLGGRRDAFAAHERTDATGRVLWNTFALHGPNGSVVGAITAVVDISERKRAEDELRRSLEILRAVTEGTTDAVFVKDADGRYQMINTAGALLMGRSAGEIIGRTDENLFTPGDARAMIDHDREIMASGRTHLYENEAETTGPGGKARTYLTTKDPMRDAAGNVVGLVGISRDITDRKRMENALRDSEQRYRAQFESSAVGIWQATPAGQTVYANPAMCALLEVESVADLAGATYHEFFTPESLARIKSEQDRRATGESASSSYEAEIVGRLGGRRHVLVSAATVGEGTNRCLIGTLTDISERKRAEEALRDSEERFQAFMDNSPAVAYLKDEHSRLVYLNQTFARTFDVTLADLLHKTDAEWLPGDVARQNRANDQRVLESGLPLETVEIVPTPGGESRSWLTLKFPLHDAAGRRFVGGMSIDVTERERAENALRISERALKQSEERLRALHDAISQPGQTFAVRIEKILRLGSAQFGLEIGMLAQISDGVYEVLDAVSPDGDIAAGLSCDAENTICNTVVQRNEPIALENVAATVWRNHPAYALFGPEAYLGAPVWVNERLFGALCFVSKNSQPDRAAFTGADREFLRLLAQWIGTELARREASEALRESKRFAESVTEHSTSIIYVRDLDTMTNVYANRDAVKFLGYTPEQMRALGAAFWADVVHPDERAQDAAHHVSLRDLPDGQVVEYERRLRHVSGQWRWLWMRESVFRRHPDGRPHQIMGTASDITPRKQAEEVLRETARALGKANEKLAALATTDALTGLKNRRAFDEHMERE